MCVFPLTSLRTYDPRCPHVIVVEDDVNVIRFDRNSRTAFVPIPHGMTSVLTIEQSSLHYRVPCAEKNASSVLLQ